MKMHAEDHVLTDKELSAIIGGASGKVLVDGLINTGTREETVRFTI